MTRPPTAQVGFLLLVSQTAMRKTGSSFLALGGMTSQTLKATASIHLITLTWYRQHFGWSAAENWRSRVVMTHYTRRCYKPRATVLKESHSDIKCWNMVFSGMEQSGHVGVVKTTARLTMDGLTRQPTDSNKQNVMAPCRVPTKLAFGVIGKAVDPSWWLVEEEELVEDLITALE